MAFRLTLAISSGEREPCISCLFAKINNDAPDSLCHFTSKKQRERERECYKSNNFKNNLNIFWKVSVQLFNPGN